MTNETIALDLADRQVSIRVIRSARRNRTLTISVDPVQGVRVLVPAHTSRSEIESLVARQSAWIEQRLEQSPRAAGEDAIPKRLPFLGRPLDVATKEGSSAALILGDDTFALHVPPGCSLAVARAAIERFYRSETERFVTAAVARLAPAVGRTPSRILVRAQRRRWGSCAADGSLRFNLRLAMLAAELADYVVVHELCHLIRRDHSPAFWAEVARVLPAYQELRARLRTVEREIPAW